MSENKNEINVNDVLLPIFLAIIDTSMNVEITSDDKAQLNFRIPRVDVETGLVHKIGDQTVYETDIKLGEEHVNNFEITLRKKLAELIDSATTVKDILDSLPATRGRIKAAYKAGGAGFMNVTPVAD